MTYLHVFVMTASATTSFDVTTSSVLFSSTIIPMIILSEAARLNPGRFVLVEVTFIEL